MNALRRFCCLFTFVTIVFISSNCVNAEIVADLRNDWVDAVNPNGNWSFKKNRSELFDIWQPDYFSGAPLQGAWADDFFPNPTHVPVWMKSVTDGFVNAHGAELDRTLSDFTSAVWTSDFDGQIEILGQAWMPNNNFRDMRWQLIVNNSVVSQGDMTSDGTITEENPFYFAAGSGGTNALLQTVSIGDTIELGLVSLSEFGNLGDTVVVEFSINTVSEPVEIAPDSVEVTRGLLAAGGVGQLQTSDNADFSIFRDPRSVISITEFIADSVSPTATPVMFEITLEGAVFSRSSVEQTVALYDFNASAFEVVSTANASRAPNPDLTITGMGTGDLSRFVGPSNAIQVRVRFRGSVNRSQFTSNTDQLYWTIQ